MSDDILNAALRYADTGFSVIPLHPKTKIAYPWKEYQTRIATSEEIEEWAEKYPNFNIGIVCGKISGLVSIDADGYEAQKWVDDHHEHTTTRLITGREGGKQYIYRYPEKDIRCATRLVEGDGWNVDIRGEGGYFVAPPSVHPNGNIYRWEEENWDEIPIYKPYKTALGIDLSQIKAGAIFAGTTKGGRNQRTAQIAGALYAQGVLLDTAIEECIKYDQESIPPQKVEDVIKTVKSVYQTAKSKEQINTQPIEEVAKALKLKAKKALTIPEPLLNPGGILSDIMDYFDKYSPMSIPLYNLACALPFLGTLCGQKVKNETGIRTNLYHFILGFSGCGKDWPSKLIDNLLTETPELNKLRSPRKLTGSAAVYTQIRNSGEHIKIFLLDELGKVLLHGKNKHAAIEGVHTAFLELYSGSTGDKGYAFEKEKLKMPYQFVSLIGQAESNSFWEQIEASDLTDGFIARCQMFESNHDPFPAAYKTPSIENVPKGLIDKLISVYNMPLKEKQGNISEKIIPNILERSEDALEYLMKWEERITEQRIKEKGSWKLSVLSRARETGEKYAMIHHVSLYGADCIKKKIGIESYKYGLALIDYLNEYLFISVENNVSESPWHRQEQKVIKAISKYATIDKPGLSFAVIFGSYCQSVSARDRQPLLDGLIKKGVLVVVQPTPGCGWTKDIYCLANN